MNWQKWNGCQYHRSVWSSFPTVSASVEPTMARSFHLWFLFCFFFYLKCDCFAWSPLPLIVMIVDGTESGLRSQFTSHRTLWMCMLIRVNWNQWIYDALAWYIYSVVSTHSLSLFLFKAPSTICHRVWSCGQCVIESMYSRTLSTSVSISNRKRKNWKKRKMCATHLCLFHN